MGCLPGPGGQRSESHLSSGNWFRGYWPRTIGTWTLRSRHVQFRMMMMSVVALLLSACELKVSEGKTDNPCLNSEQPSQSELRRVLKSSFARSDYQCAERALLIA